MATAKRAKIFWTGRSQAVRLPKEFRFEGEAVWVHRAGRAVVLEPLDGWPEGWTESFVDADEQIERPRQGAIEVRAPLE